MSFHLPIKWGARARVKGFTTFEASVGFWRFFISLLFATLVLLFQTLVFGVHRVSAEKLLTRPPQKKSTKNAPTEIDREEHHHDEDNRISHTPEPLNITDQERRAKLEAL
jgi:hypothetical protein